jgi:uncharacterized LabA/DUF88 family protein
MADSSDSLVAVYIDFDNIVISRYDQVNGRNSFTRDRVRWFDPSSGQGPEASETDTATAARLQASVVDVGAMIDFAASFGTLVLTRAYADWSASVNAEYRHQLVGRAVDLVQLFPAAAYAKNGADIRLAVDAVEDMFRLPDLTHVVIVAGDSDYVPLAQRCKRLGRYVVGIGVAGSTSRTLAAACDEFYSYDALPGIERPAPPDPATRAEAAPKRRTATKEASPVADAANAADSTAQEPTAKVPSRGGKSPRRSAATNKVEAEAAARAEALAAAEAAVRAAAAESDDADVARDIQQEATSLLERALRIGHEKDDAEWLHSSAVKSQIKRMDPSFSEKELGYRSFSDFIKSRAELAELDDSSTTQLVRRRPEPEPEPAVARSEVLGTPKRASRRTTKPASKPAADPEPPTAPEPETVSEPEPASDPAPAGPAPAPERDTAQVPPSATADAAAALTAAHGSETAPEPAPVSDAAGEPSGAESERPRTRVPRRARG